MKQLHIRPYKVADLAELMAAWEAANALAHPFLDDDFVAQVRHDIPALYIPNTDTWVAELDSTVVGFIALMGHEIGAIFLDPKFHGAGIGKALLDKAQQLHQELTVEVFKENTIGRRFYDSCGFVMVKQEFHKQSGQQVLRLKLTV